MLWLLFWGALVVHVVHLYMYVVNGTAQQTASVDVSPSPCLSPGWNIGYRLIFSDLTKLFQSHKS